MSNLENEIDYLMEVYADSDENQSYTEDEALSDIIDASEGEPESKALLNEARKMAIKKGWYIPVSDEDLNQMLVSSGKKYDFKLSGVKYQWAGR